MLRTDFCRICGCICSGSYSNGADIAVAALGDNADGGSISNLRDRLRNVFAALGDALHDVGGRQISCDRLIGSSFFGLHCLLGNVNAQTGQTVLVLDDEALQQLLQLLDSHALQLAVGDLILDQLLDLGNQGILVHLAQLGQQFVQLRLDDGAVDLLQSILQVFQSLFDVLLGGGVLQLFQGLLNILAVQALQLVHDLFQLFQLGDKGANVDLFQEVHDGLDILLVQRLQNFEQVGDILPFNVKVLENLCNFD